MERVGLDDEDWVEVGAVPDPAALCPDFEALWALHPPAPDVLTLYGRPTPIPRYQRAYGRDYAFSHQVSRAEPVPALLEPCLGWVRSVDDRLNGLLLNWYDGAQGHRIGPHRDSAQGLIPGSPILTLSFGEARVFRLRRWKGTDRVDVKVDHGSVITIPWETNLRWTHEVVHRARDRGRRISVTARAFS